MTTVAELTASLVRWLDRLMPADTRTDDLVRTLDETFGADRRPVTAAACERIERTAHRYSRHLELLFDPGGIGDPDVDSPGWPPTDPEEVACRAAAVREVRRLPGGVCVIRVDGLDPLGLAQPYVDAAFALARCATGIVLDLRHNGGGDPATVARIAGLLLGDTSVHLSTVVYRDRERQWWTPELPTGTATAANLAVLVGPGTFSSGEALAYHLRAHDRATLVGAPTPGAADHITPIRLTAQVTGHLPEAYVRDAVTGGNWEGRGVVPDVPSEDPETTAVELLTR
jgi:C-terminal processing protease CtpA/Prc